MIHQTNVIDARRFEMRTGSTQIAKRRHSQKTAADAEIERPLVLVVDGDEKIRTTVHALMSSVGIDTACFGSIRELSESALHQRPGCLVLDVRMPGGSSGLDFQSDLVANGDPKPIVFLTGHGDIPMTVQAMKQGAVDFLTKPARDQELLDAVAVGIARDIERRANARVIKQHLVRLETLTARERQVLREVVRGRMNKQIAFDFGISEVTVKLHRSNVMRKMQAASVGELIRAWETLPAEIREEASSHILRRKLSTQSTSGRILQL